MKTVILATLSFAAFNAIPGLLISLTILYSQAPRRPDALGDFLLVAYFAAVSSSLATIGFLVPTALSRFWRRLTASRAAIIASVLGLIAPIVTLVVAAVDATALVPLFRTAPWVAGGLFYGLPGVILGTAAPLIAKAFHSATPKVNATGAFD